MWQAGWLALPCFPSSHNCRKGSEQELILAFRSLVAVDQMFGNPRLQEGRLCLPSITKFSFPPLMQLQESSVLRLVSAPTEATG